MKNTLSNPAFSLVTTVLNDRAGCASFFERMAQQEQLPEEVVIVDGGSRDGTWELLQETAAQAQPWQLRVQQERGCNVARGRNLAIEAASHEWIVSTDIGCDWEPQWLAELVQPFQTDATCQAVMGSWAVRAEDLTSVWARVEYALLREPKLVATKQSDASSRAIAYTRALWKKIGGYPEDLTLAADDMVFSLLLHRAAAGSIASAPTVRCYWMRPGTLKAFCKEARRNFFGAGEAGLWLDYGVKVAGRIGAEAALTLLGLILLCARSFSPGALALALALGSFVMRVVKLCPAVFIARSLGVSQPWRRLLVFEYATKIQSILGYWAGRSRGAARCQDCRQRLRASGI